MRIRKGEKERKQKGERKGAKRTILTSNARIIETDIESENHRNRHRREQVQSRSILLDNAVDEINVLRDISLSDPGLAP